MALYRDELGDLWEYSCKQRTESASLEEIIKQLQCISAHTWHNRTPTDYYYVDAYRTVCIMGKLLHAPSRVDQSLLVSHSCLTFPQVLSPKIFKCSYLVPAMFFYRLPAIVRDIL